MHVVGVSGGDWQGNALVPELYHFFRTPAARLTLLAKVWYGLACTGVER